VNRFQPVLLRKEVGVTRILFRLSRVGRTDAAESDFTKIIDLDFASDGDL